MTYLMYLLQQYFIYIAVDYPVGKLDYIYEAIFLQY
jgi:hypothetical protein